MLFVCDSHFSGSYFGYKRDKIENPTAYNDLERDIPEQVWYVHPAMLMLVGGSLPFGAVFIELFFILSAVWLHKVCFWLRFVGRLLWVSVGCEASKSSNIVTLVYCS